MRDVSTPLDMTSGSGVTRDVRTAVALGSNEGDRLENLRAARRAITALPQVGPPILASPIYETEPVAMEPGAQNVFNCAIEFEYNGEPDELLEELQRIEESLGREREHNRNVSRKIDIDLLYCREHKIDNPRLQLPHPRMHLRKFVLQPLNDIRPELVLPNQSRSVRELLAQLTEPGKVIRLMENW